MEILAVEFLGVFYLLADGLSSAVVTNLLLKSYCLKMPNLTEANCSGVIPKEVEDVVQPLVADQLMIKTLIETLLPGLAVLFVGPWSDVRGRRPLLLLSFFGSTLSYIIWTVLSMQVGHLNPFYFLASSVPIALTGGNTTFFMAVICIINDTTSATKKTFKMSAFEAGCMVGVFFSQLFTARISMGPYGFTRTFCLSATIYFSLFLYACFFLPETVAQGNNREKFSFDVFTTFFKSRSNHVTAVMILLVVAHLSFITVSFGDGGIFYLNMQKRFGWSLTEFSQYVAVIVVIGAIDLFFVSWFMSSFLKLSDFKTLLIVSFPRIFSSIVIALTTNWRLVYVSMSIGCVSLLITPAYRSKMSKLVPAQEYGRVLSFMMFTEALVPVTSSVLYTSVYDRIIDVFPGGIFFVSAGLISISFLSIVLASIISWYYPNHDFSQLRGPEIEDCGIITSDEDPLITDTGSIS